MHETIKLVLALFDTAIAPVRENGAYLLGRVSPRVYCRKDMSDRHGTYVRGGK
jgi:hypothetical protein